MIRRPTFDDVSLVLKLYDLRREPRMRDESRAGGFADARDDVHDAVG